MKYRCDKPMRRSKEKCNTPFYKRWQCTGECKTCICCLAKTESGIEEHINLLSKAKEKK